MLEYLLLLDILKSDSEQHNIKFIFGENTLHNMKTRKTYLKDEFINKYKLPIHTIKDPLSDTINMEK